MIIDQFTEGVEQSASVVLLATKLIEESRSLSDTAIERKEDENKEIVEEKVDEKTEEERAQDSSVEPKYPHVTYLGSTENEAEDLNTQRDADSKGGAGELKKVLEINEAAAEGSVNDGILSDRHVQRNHEKTVPEINQNISDGQNRSETNENVDPKTEKPCSENKAEWDKNDAKTLEHDAKTATASDKKLQCVTDTPDHQTQANANENQFGQNKPRVYGACSQIGEKPPGEEKKAKGKEQAHTSTKVVGEGKPREKLENLQNRSETVEFQRETLDGTKRRADGTNKVLGDIGRNSGEGGAITAQASDDAVMKKQDPNKAKDNKKTLLLISQEKDQLINKEVKIELSRTSN